MHRFIMPAARVYIALLAGCLSCEWKEDPAVTAWIRYADGVRCDARRCVTGSTIAEDPEAEAFLSGRHGVS
jgi:hypothetical protein